MRAMTCQDLGGPCGFTHHGSTADEIIKAQDEHLREMVAGGDQAHAGALRDMKRRWRHPISGMGWYRSVKREFGSRPEDPAGTESDSRSGNA